MLLHRTTNHRRFAMKKIGTDMSIAVCRVEGYMVMEFSPKKLKKGDSIDKGCGVYLTASNPVAWNDSGKPSIAPDAIQEPLYALDEEYSFNDLLEILKDEKKAKTIASVCDWKNCPVNLENPTEYDFLCLASDIHACYSLSFD